MTDTPSSSGTDQDEDVRYPKNSVVGIIDQAAAEGVADALTAAGFLDSEIEILCGQAAGEKLRANTGRGGIFDIAMRVVSALGMPDDETAVKNEYADALRDGDLVVVVMAPTDERKELAARVLREHGGRFVNFMGRSTIERMVQRGSS